MIRYLKSPILLIGLTFLLCSCGIKNDGSEELRIRSSFSQNLDPDYLNVIKKDSIPLARNAQHLFDRVVQLSPELFNKNKIFILSRPDVKIGLMDTTGNFLQKITHKGTGPGELLAARSAKAWTDEDGDIYILTNANAFSLYVYSKSGQFKYTTRLYEQIEQVYHPKEGFYHMSDKKNGRFTLTMTIGSSKNSPYKAEYYKHAFSIAQFTINAANGKIIDAAVKLPLKQFREIQDGIANQKITWGSSSALFRKHEDKFYLTFPFSKKVYVFNDEFEQLTQISLKSLYLYEPGFSYKMQQAPEELFERTYLEHRTYLENTYVKNLQILNDLLIVQYLAPLKESEYLHHFPTRKSILEEDNWEDFFVKRDQMFLIYDMNTGNERLIRLSKDHDIAAFLDKKQLLTTAVKDGVEDQLIYKYTLGEPINSF